MENHAVHIIGSQPPGSILPSGGLRKTVNIQQERSKENSQTAPKISLLKSSTQSSRFTVPKLSNVLLLPLESCQISLLGCEVTKLNLPLGRAMLVCGATSTARNIHVVGGSCIAVHMSLQECNAINPLQKTNMSWSDIPVFSMSQQLSSLASLANRHVCNGIAASSNVVSAIATMSFVEVILLLSSRQPTEQFNLSDQDLSEIEEYIDDNLEKSICLEELAKICDTSVNKFAKAFKAKTGTSPYKFVLSRRLSLACDLLKKTDDSLADIAYETGFSSQSHMTEFFRQNLSTTPGKYRTMA